MEVYKSCAILEPVQNLPGLLPDLVGYGQTTVAFYGSQGNSGIAIMVAAPKWWCRFKAWVGKACRVIANKVIPIVRPIARAVLPFIPAAGPAVALAADKVMDKVQSISSNVSTLISSNMSNLTASGDVAGALQQEFQYRVCEVDQSGQPVLVDSIASPDSEWQSVPLTGASLKVPNAAHGSNYYNVTYRADPNKGRFAQLIQRHADLAVLGAYPGLRAGEKAPVYIQRRLKWRYMFNPIQNGQFVAAPLSATSKILIQFGTENGVTAEQVE